MASDRTTRDERGGPNTEEDRFPILSHVPRVSHDSPRQGKKERRRVRDITHMARSR